MSEPWIHINDGIGTMMTIEEFVSCVECGGFIDYDGYAEYCIKNVVIGGYGHHIRPSDVKKGKINKEYTHVMWYNR